MFSLLLSGPMGGRISLLAATRFRYEALLPLGLLIQSAPPLLADYLAFGDVSQATLTAWLVGSLVLMLACLLNWRYVGFRVAVLGVALNALVIMANSGMPVSVVALEYLGVSGVERQVEALTPLYHLANEQSVLGVLGDVMPVPGPPLVRSVVSLGDLCLMVGIALVVLEGCGALARAKSITGSRT